MITYKFNPISMRVFYDRTDDRFTFSQDELEFNLTRETLEKFLDFVSYVYENTKEEKLNATRH